MTLSPFERVASDGFTVGMVSSLCLHFAGCEASAWAALACSLVLLGCEVALCLRRTGWWR